ncbi:hypothetical protein BCV72DRAFT_192864, partial [Rhizopus microsporus var. microsporus]
LRNLKEEGHEIIGHIQKSKGDEKEEARIRLLQTMATRLQERWSIKSIYASPFSHSTE